MKTTLYRTFSATALLAGLAGCSAEAPQVGVADQGRVGIEVAPITYEGIGSACYAITVTNGADVVWQNPMVCSGAVGGNPAYGNGALGDISYVGPCVDTNEEGTTTNTVTVALHTLYDEDGVAITDWVVPPPVTIDVECEEDADTGVPVSFVVIREADQGFFDIAVDFEDLHCSAKVDCQDELVFVGEDRAPTIVIALTCDSGEGGFTNLYMDPITLACVDSLNVMTYVTIDPTNSPGNFAANAPTGFVGNVLGSEGTSNGGTSSYWTVAIGLGDLSGYVACGLVGLEMTAGDGTPFASYDQYPVIGGLSDENPIMFWSEGDFGCENPLDGEGSGLTTSYADGGDLQFYGCLTEDTDLSSPESVDTDPCP